MGRSNQSVPPDRDNTQAILQLWEHGNIFRRELDTLNRLYNSTKTITEIIALITRMRDDIEDDIYSFALMVG